MQQPYLDFPFHIDGRGRSGATAEDDHVRDMIHQLLFTDLGSRPNRPDFGCGLKSLLFLPNSDALATATQVLVKGSLQRWLENEIQVESVEVNADEEKLVVNVVYTKRANGERRAEQFVGSA